MLNTVARLFLLVGTVLLGWAVFLMVFPIVTKAPGPPIVLEELEHDLGQRVPGSYTVEVRIQNRGDKPHRIIGLQPG